MDWKIIACSLIIAGFVAFVCYQLFRFKTQKIKLEHQEKILKMRQDHEKEMIKLRHDQEKEKAMTLNKNTIINYKHKIIKEFVKHGKTSSEHIENLSAVLKLYNPENQQP